MMYNLCDRYCRIYGIFNVMVFFFLFLEIYFFVDYIIYGVLNFLKMEF